MFDDTFPGVSVASSPLPAPDRRAWWSSLIFHATLFGGVLVAEYSRVGPPRLSGTTLVASITNISTVGGPVDAFFSPGMAASGTPSVQASELKPQATTVEAHVAMLPDLPGELFASTEPLEAEVVSKLEPTPPSEEMPDLAEQKPPPRSVASVRGGVASAATPGRIGVDTLPLSFHNPPPIYPTEAIHHGWQGTVTLVVSIDRDGGVSHVGIQTSSGYSLLDESASSAIAHWHFHPATQAGEDVACDVLLPIIFQLRKFEPARMSHVSIDATPSGM